MASLRKFLASIKAGILLHDHGIPKVQRQGDSYIMDHILESKMFTPRQIRKLNYCRLYLQAITISDLTTTTGNALDPSKLVGHPLLQSSRATWNSINQERPTKAEWLLWKRANLIWSTADGRLNTPHKNWTEPIHKQRNSHFAYRKRNNMWIHLLNSMYQCNKILSSGRAKRRNQAMAWGDIPPPRFQLKLPRPTATTGK